MTTLKVNKNFTQTIMKPNVTDPVTPNVVTLIGPHDILLGRKSIAINNAGNMRFRSLIQSRKDDYISTSRRRTKDIITKQISKVISDRGGRFLRLINDPKEAKALGVCPSEMDNAWVEVSEDAIHNKIKQSLRDLDREQDDSKRDKYEDSTRKTNQGTAKRSHYLAPEDIESFAAKKMKKDMTAIADTDDDIEVSVPSQPEEHQATMIAETCRTVTQDVNFQLFMEEKRCVLLKFLQKENITIETAITIILEEKEKSNSVTTTEAQNVYHSPSQVDEQDRKVAAKNHSSNLVNNSDNQISLGRSVLEDARPWLVKYPQEINDLGNVSGGTNRLSVWRDLLNHQRTSSNFINLFEPTNPHSSRFPFDYIGNNSTFNVRHQNLFYMSNTNPFAQHIREY